MSALAVVAACIASHAAELPGIIDRDDRVAVESDTWPWSAIGRVNKRGAGFCTGTLVEADLVATAAHCLVNPRTGRLHRPEFLTFVAGYARGDYHGLSGVQRYEFPACAAAEPGDRLSRIAGDVVFLRLTETIAGVAPVPLLEREPDSDDGTLVLAGYQQDRPYMLSAHSGCRPIAWLTEERVLVHSCDATRGASGSPLLTNTPDGWRIVALHVGIGSAGQGPRSAVGLASTWPIGADLARSLSPDAGACSPINPSAGRSGG